MVLIKVNNYEISEQEFIAEVSKLCIDKGIAEADNELKRIAVNNLIEGLLIIEEARRHNISVCNDELEQEMLDYMMRFENEKSYLQVLEEMNASTSLLKKHLKEKLIVKKYLETFQKVPFEATNEQLLKLYRENIESFQMDEVVRVSHILVKPEMGLEKANQVRANISTPEDFNSVVGCCSSCPSCSQAGDLGFITRDKMVFEFEQAAFSLKLFEISQPVTTQFGYHIIMLTDRKKGIILPFDEVKELLNKRLKQIEFELRIVRLIKELREKADIYIDEQIFAS